MQQSERVFQWVKWAVPNGNIFESFEVIPETIVSYEVLEVLQHMKKNMLFMSE